jgi:hypothetical protein
MTAKFAGSGWLTSTSALRGPCSPITDRRPTSPGLPLVGRCRRALFDAEHDAPELLASEVELIIDGALPHVNLEDALAILLALLDREPHTYSRGAARWGSRLILERRLALPDAQLTLASLATLPGSSARAGAEALIELADGHGLRRVDELLITWLRAHGHDDTL